VPLVLQVLLLLLLIVVRHTPLTLLLHSPASLRSHFVDDDTHQALG